MKETTFIYGLFDPRNYQLRYIGKSDNPEKRLKQHIASAKRGVKKYINSWILHLFNDGVEPSIEILEEVSVDNWQKVEKIWISECKKFGLNITNLTDGGEGVVGYTPTEDFKKKLSIAKTGKPLSSTHREKIKLAMQSLVGVPRSDEVRQRISESNKGKKLSEETREKIGQSSKGRNVGLKRSEETKRKMSEAQVGIKNHRYGKALTEEHKAMLKDINTGRKHTEESKRKISESKVGKPRSEATRKKISESRKRLFEQKRSESE